MFLGIVLLSILVLVAGCWISYMAGYSRGQKSLDDQATTHFTGLNSNLEYWRAEYYRMREEIQKANKGLGRLNRRYKGLRSAFLTLKAKHPEEETYPIVKKAL